MINIFKLIKTVCQKSKLVADAVALENSSTDDMAELAPAEIPI